jgi:MarR family transcriptional regulator, transcriptional regulator for hemolysin
MEVATESTKAAAGPPRPLVANLGWLLSTAGHVLTTQLTAALEGVGVSPRSYCILTTAMTGELTQIELARAIGLDKTTMVVAIDELEAAGLAERRPASEDRRARVIVVTEAGERKVAEAVDVVDRVHAEALAELPAAERKAFVDALSRLVGGRLASPAPCARPVRRR